MMSIWKKKASTTTSTTTTGILNNNQMLEIYHAGIDEYALVHINDRGLVRQPTLLYPLDGQGKSEVQYDCCSYIRESIRQNSNNNNGGGIFHRNVKVEKYNYNLLGGGFRYEEYKDGGTRTTTTTTSNTNNNNDNDEIEIEIVARIRRSQIRNAMIHAWKGYKTYAWGNDELKPVRKTGTNNWGGMGTTLVDSLSTLWLMNLKTEFWEGRDWVRDYLNHEHVQGTVSVFETTIRNLGGLLSAYDLSGDSIFLIKAIDLGDRLLKSFDNSSSGLPFGTINLNTGKSKNHSWLGNNVLLAEIGTLQIEFNYLSKVTKNPKYANKVNNIIKVLSKMEHPNNNNNNKVVHSGLYPIYIRNDGTKPKYASNSNTNKISLGAMGDSFYEYLLKLWLLNGKQDDKLRNMYDDAINGIIDNLVFKSQITGLTYIAEMDLSSSSNNGGGGGGGGGGKVDHKMDHLVCFMGGLLALGAYTDPLGLESERAQRDLQLGKSLAYTCYQMYSRNYPTGISSEYVLFPHPTDVKKKRREQQEQLQKNDGHGGDSGGNNRIKKNEDFVIPRNAPYYILRPETVETFYILYTLTKDPIYREWGWEIFTSIETWCKTEIAYGGLQNVVSSSVENQDLTPEDKMESFFLAETLKYLYLLNDVDSNIDILNKHVFNTEAHPLKVFSDSSSSSLITEI